MFWFFVRQLTSTEKLRPYQMQSSILALLTTAWCHHVKVVQGCLFSSLLFLFFCETIDFDEEGAVEADAEHPGAYDDEV